MLTNVFLSILKLMLSAIGLVKQRYGLGATCYHVNHVSLTHAVCVTKKHIL